MPAVLHAAPPVRAAAGSRAAGERGAEPRPRPCLRRASRASARCAAANGNGGAQDGLTPLDHSVPTAGFASIPSALAAIANGELVIVMDDEDRENEGDLICAADKCSTETLAFMVRHTSGVVCVAVEDERLNALGLPQMVESKARRQPYTARLALWLRAPPAPLPRQENEEKLRTAFCVTCDLKVRAGSGGGAAAAPHVPAQRRAAAPQLTHAACRTA